MRDLASHILDLVCNSIRAQANSVEVAMEENSARHELKVTIKDNGKGMDAEQLQEATNPFFTTRTTRNTGLGIPLMQMTCEQTGGSFHVQSALYIGTQIEAIFKTDNPNCLPLGDLSGQMALLFATNPLIDFLFSYSIDNSIFSISSNELKQHNIDIQLPPMIQATNEYISNNLFDIFSTRKGESFIC